MISTSDPAVTITMQGSNFVVTDGSTGQVMAICPSLTGLTRCIIGLERYYGLPVPPLTPA